LEQGKKILAIDGHMDTVDIGNRDNWSFDPLGGEIKNGFVHGGVQLIRKVVQLLLLPLEES